ncbi:MAG TPA: regulatory protein RecX [Acidobacteriaceae bacterium]|nr:regulatory protein RecX [Acidobacteriaceae bacterium]
MAFASGRARKPKQPLDAAALYEYAVRSLGRKMRTVVELKRLLRARVEPGEDGDAKITAVLVKLTEQKYLDDATYASYYTRQRQEHEKFGKRRVQQDLTQRGVPSAIITQTLDDAYEGLPEETQLRRFLERKRLRPPQDDKQTARLLRMLVRAGFSTSSIFKVLKQWKAPDDALAAIESIETMESIESMDEDFDTEKPEQE